ncbi:hypothetical protein DYB38_003632 [Aphanomyces astaci]|uniref:Formyl transferase N-terminal domain-containing protein n=1 Tax=Aphanomyces astaci TaxID=112090 RepID=A0A397D7W9_APHAT|nr:hypothetical protein DYB38_003632 [Aphanomyces astaci]
MGKARHKAPVPVKAFALEHNLVVHHIPDNVYAIHSLHITSECYHRRRKSLKDWAMPPSAAPFDIGVVVSFGYFIHPHMLANVKHGAINMHPSLLPKVQYIIIEYTTHPTHNYSLSAHLAEEGAECVVQVLQDLDEKKKHAVVQDHAVATTAPKIKREVER